MQLVTERVVDGHLEVPIHEFRHPETQSTISLVGMLHTARPSYYQNINEYVQARENNGSLVHVEGGRLPDDSELVKYPTWIREFTPRLDDALGIIYDSDPQEGLVSQFDELHFHYKDSWEVHDANGAEIIALLGRNRAKFVISTLERLIAVENGSKKEHIVADTIRAVCFTPATDGVVVRHRNKLAIKAVEAALDTNPDQSITLLWGSFHLRGIAKGILANNYVHDNTIWHRET